MADLTDVVSQLADSLDNIEAAMAPLLKRPLADTLASLSGPVERATLLFWLAFTIHSSARVHAMLQAADPEQTGVMDEVSRIKVYNRKILSAQKELQDGTPSGDSSTEQRNMEVDKDAASRFIAAAIRNQPAKPAASGSFYNAAVSVTDERHGPGRHSRLSTFAKQDQNRQLGKVDGGLQSSSEEEELEVFDGDDAQQEPASSNSSDDQIAARLVSGVIPAEEASLPRIPLDSKREKKKKQKRPRDDGASAPAKLTDPLQGYINELHKKKQKKRNDPLISETTDSVPSSHALSEAAGQADDEKTRKERKKERKRLKKLEKAGKSADTTE